MGPFRGTPGGAKQYREASRCSTGPRVMHARTHWKVEDVKAQRTPTVRAEHEEGRTTRHTRLYPNPTVTYYSFPLGGVRSPPPTPNLEPTWIARVVAPFGADPDGLLRVDRLGMTWASV